MAVVIHSDNYGTEITVPSDYGYPKVETWADNYEIILRQEEHGQPTADLIKISMGQAYDLLEAISRHLGTPPVINGRSI